MIAELFYPKELKKRIADLRKNNDLNEKALRNLNRPIYSGILISIFMNVFLSYYGSLYASLIFPILLILSTWLEAKHIYNFSMLPYLGSDSKTSRILKIQGVHVLATRLELEEEGTKELYIIKPTSEWLKVGIPKVGDRMEIFINPRFPGFAMPNNAHFKEKYSLKKHK